jgi:AcrR family transcriptional regulator
MKDTKDLILRTAYNMFLHNNYEAVTINSIIKATGLTKGALYHYYISKEELFKAVVDKYMIENRPDISVEFLTLKEFIQYVIDVNKGKLTKFIIENPNSHNDIPLHFLTITLAAIHYYPNFIKKGVESYRNQVSRWENRLRKAVDNGEIRDDIDIDATTSLFLNIGSGVGWNMIRDGSLTVKLDTIEKQYWELYKYIKK